MSTETHKNFPIQYVQWSEIFKSIFQHTHTALNIMKLTHVIQIYSSMFSVKNGITSINIFYTGSHKIFRCITTYGEGNFQSIVLNTFIALNTIKLTHVIQAYNCNLSFLKEKLKRVHKELKTFNNCTSIVLVHVKRSNKSNCINFYTIKKCLLLKIENKSVWVNLTHFQEKTHLFALELIFISSSRRVDECKIWYLKWKVRMA